MQNAIDLDQEALEVQLALKTTDGLAAAKRIYTEGGYSKSYARVMLTTALGAEVPKGTSITGVSASGPAVLGKALATTAMGSMTLDIQYVTTSDQATYVDCQVGGLATPNTNGCFAPSGSLTITDSNGVAVSVGYTYNPLTDNDNARTIQGFSTSADSKMLNCPIGCPYPDFEKFYTYYGVADYGDQWVLAALDGTATTFTNGNGDFSTGTGNMIDARVGKQKSENDPSQQVETRVLTWFFLLLAHRGDKERNCLHDHLYVCAS